MRRGMAISDSQSAADARNKRRDLVASSYAMTSIEPLSSGSLLFVPGGSGGGCIGVPTRAVRVDPWMRCRSATCCKLTSVMRSHGNTIMSEEMCSLIDIKANALSVSSSTQCSSG